MSWRRSFSTEVAGAGEFIAPQQTAAGNTSKFQRPFPLRHAPPGAALTAGDPEVR
jgi:hypothetical protein